MTGERAHALPETGAPVPAHLLCLLDGWQRSFPLVPRPFAAIARACGLSEDEVLAGLADLQRAGVLGRVGATIRPNTVGVSMLAAMQVPPEHLDAVAHIVNAEPGVNHNYEREHAINLWFVIAAPDRNELSQALARIRTASGLEVLELPLERSYYIDLGFSLGTPARKANHTPRHAPHAPAPPATVRDRTDREVLAALERGLMLVPRPYQALAAQVGLSEADVMGHISRLIETGVITRFGLIVRHRRLGYRANAMVVFDVPDARVDDVGERFAQEDYVTLCYRRPRHGARWPYNLFCMIHGRDRLRVREQVAELTRIGSIAPHDHAVLFSRRCYLQRGTRIAPSSPLQQEAAQ